MEKDKKGFSWDGKSRVVTDLYRKRFDEIFGKKEEEELKESYKQSLRNKKERENKEEEEYLKELKDKL
tara:strand:+ start:744 stop:947 length:204 start_codon:yes stop_codon:yes gene_type:complete